MNMDKDVIALDRQTYIISEGEGRGQTHSYLLIGDDCACLLDTGFGYTNMKDTVEKITGKTVFVICTHGHLDHIGSNGYFDKVYLHPADYALYKLHSSPKFRLSFIRQRYLKKEVSEEIVASEEFRERTKNFWNLKTADAVCGLEDGQIFELGNRRLKIIHTPGHTGGSVCVLDAGFGRLYSGDTICELGILLNLEESAPIRIYCDSLKKLWDIRGQYTEIFSGHQKIPLNLDTLADYVECAERVMERKLTGETVQYRTAVLEILGNM